ncbi:MAG: C25 family cysteine peptidase [Brevefilum sp.]|nr:C25 family cysteine peptidase [Brevefilum sp.]
MTDANNQLDYLRAIDRYRFLTILNAADHCEEYQFAKQATMLWLANFPGDLYVKYYQAKTFIKTGKNDQGRLLYENLIELDPLFVEPVKDMSELTAKKDLQSRYRSIYQYLVKNKASNQTREAWLSPLWEARSKFEQGDFSNAMQYVHQSLLKAPQSPIPAVLHLQIANNLENQEMVSNLSEIYYDAWPKCLQINVVKAISEIEQGLEARAVERLHWVESQDNAGQVITRMLGNNHQFKDMWPEYLQAHFDLPIPASVSAYLGWNQLNPGSFNFPTFSQSPFFRRVTHTPSISETHEIRVAQASTRSVKNMPASHADDSSKQKVKKGANSKDIEKVQTAFAKIAKRLKKLDLERTDTRFPVYVILSSRKQLEKIYGPNTADVIDKLLQELMGHIQGLPDWDAKIYYPDDSASMARLGLKPFIANDPWQVKLALADLDDHLEKQGEMIGALLIVGGPEIVPFHHLPNPTSDNDLDVPSDNPYGTIDENYFIPQWPVGRLPGETGSDAGLLLSQIRGLIYQYKQKSKKSKSSVQKFASIFTWILDLFSNWNRNVNSNQSLGYSAEIWKEASAEVYKTAGQGKELQLSPPIHSGSLALNNSLGHKIGYFNLHGIKDGANWYGQKDFSSQSPGPDYPIALSPNMFSEKIRSPKLVFTEACYGANVLEKRHEEAISLKFLDTGTKSFVGSTCIAYGSVMPPLIAADYLANAFWKQVLDGQPAGYALMQAKLNLVEEMTKTQGFLDGEDQKTILSFILYGDPLAVHDGISTLPKPLLREKMHPEIKTISDSDLVPENNENDMPNNVSKQVKKIVESYLPGLENAQMKMNKSYQEFNTKKVGRSNDAQRYVVTLQKSFDLNLDAEHHHYARMTFNEKGKLVKFTTSR